jgi:hypothetical protein
MTARFIIGAAVIAAAAFAGPAASHDDREERKVVCFDTAGAEVDGAPDDWRREHDVVSAGIAAQAKARSNGHLPSPSAVE